MIEEKNQDQYKLNIEESDIEVRIPSIKISISDTSKHSLNIKRKIFALK